MSAAAPVNGGEHRCPSCDEPLVEGAGFCEACGAPTGRPAAVPAPPPPTSPDPGAPSIPTASVRPPCERCGAPIGADDYCTGCGVRALSPVTVDDRGRSAFATHRGLRHPRNEDAGALATTAEGWPVLVVADGVSSSPNPHLAAGAAVAAVTERLGGRPFTGPQDLSDAVTAANAAASAIPADTDPSWPADGTMPACTIVVAVAAPDQVHLANVGDARGYVVRSSPDHLETVQLSADDSTAAQAVEAGLDLERALRLPGGHAITAWLGADAPALSPHVRSEPAGPHDLVLVCSDGLWNYAATPEALDALLTTVLPLRPEPGWLGGACKDLVQWSIAQGGADNICVALAPLDLKDAP